MLQVKIHNITNSQVSLDVAGRMSSSLDRVITEDPCESEI
jgi:hypothetical protein